MQEKHKLMIVNDIKEYLGKDMDVKIIFVDKIEMVHTGKRQVVISKVPFAFKNNKVNLI
jgi:hypothetical protein